MEFNGFVFLHIFSILEDELTAFIRWRCKHIYTQYTWRWVDSHHLMAFCCWLYPMQVALCSLYIVFLYLYSVYLKLCLQQPSDGFVFLLILCILEGDFTATINQSWVVLMFTLKTAGLGGSDVPSDWRPGGHGLNLRWGQQHSFVEIDHEIFSAVILSLPLIQEGQLSVSGERMCTILINRLEDWLPNKHVVR